MRRYSCALMVLALLPATGVAADRVGSEPMLAQASMATEEREFLVFFDWDVWTLSPEAQQIVATAASEFVKTGQARIVATGHTDTSGSKEYNQWLSERRAESVKEELVNLGVPADRIDTIGMGQTDLLVPTADGVREAQNRRVTIAGPVAVAAPPPVAAAAPTPPPPPPAVKRWAVGLGGWSGYNLKETDRDSDKTSHLVGANLNVDYMATPNIPISVNAAGFNTLGTAEDNGWGGRFTLGSAYQFNETGNWHPFVGVDGGYILGKGVQDSWLVGPVVGVKFDVTETFYIHAKAGYDYLFRNSFSNGVINGGLGGGIRF